MSIIESRIWYKRNLEHKPTSWISIIDVCDIDMIQDFDCKDVIQYVRDETVCRTVGSKQFIIDRLPFWSDDVQVTCRFIGIIRMCINCTDRWNENLLVSVGLLARTVSFHCTSPRSGSARRWIITSALGDILLASCGVIKMYWEEFSRAASICTRHHVNKMRFNIWKATLGEVTIMRILCLRLTASM
jgi:hypothetical protein